MALIAGFVITVVVCLGGGVLGLLAQAVNGITKAARDLRSEKRSKGGSVE